MERISESKLSKIIKDYFFLNTIIIELDGIIEGHISMVNAVCRYNHKDGILYVFELLNNIRIDLSSEYEILFDRDNKKLEIKLDNGVNLTLIVLKNEKK